MPSGTLLDNVSIVLVGCRTPANIGATARCMMNMGLSRLVLVRPPVDRHGDAFRLAAGADEILKNSLTAATLAQAVAGHGMAVGVSRHSGRLRRNSLAPREMAGQVIPLLASNRVALVFGGEINGLENSDIALCQMLVAIPSAEAFPSLNLSHAVMVLAYELFVASHSKTASGAVELARSEDLERFYLHLQQVLQDIGFLEREQPDRMMLSLRQIFGRAKLEVRDVSILRGILSAIDRLN